MNNENPAKNGKTGKLQETKVKFKDKSSKVKANYNISNKK